MPIARRWFSTAMKASPTVQKLIRQHGLESAVIKATGPKGTVTTDDVKLAAAAAAEADAMASVPVQVEIPAATTHLLEPDAVPTVATTCKKELMNYFKTMRKLTLNP